MAHCTDCGLFIRAHDGDLILMGDHPYHIDCFDILVDKARDDHADRSQAAQRPAQEQSNQ